MPQHPDNVTPVDRGIIQTEELYRECFRMAERLIVHEGHADSFETTEARERSQALIPIVALDIKNHMMNLVGVEHAQQSRVEETQSSYELVIRGLKKHNDAAGK